MNDPSPPSRAPDSPVLPVPAEPSAAPSQDARTMAMLAHLLAIFTGFIGPLVIWLVKKDEDAFVDDQGKEALNFQITVLIACFALAMPSLIPFVILLTFPALLAVAVANVVFCILATVQANQGVRYRYPVTLRLIT